MQLSALDFENIRNNKGNFEKIEIKGFQKTGRPGYPALPQLSRIIEIPHQAGN